MDEVLVVLVYVALLLALVVLLTVALPRPAPPDLHGYALRLAAHLGEGTAVVIDLPPGTALVCNASGLFLSPCCRVPLDNITGDCVAGSGSIVYITGRYCYCSP